MRIWRENRVSRRAFSRRDAAAFTLIELMFVCALMALICATAVPSIYQITKKEGMRRAIGDLKDVCDNARSKAIFSGREVAVIFYPPQRKFGIGGSGAATIPMSSETSAVPEFEAAPGTGITGVIPDDISLEMLDVNLSEYKDSEWTRIRFYPNGTCDEATIVYRSEKEYRKLTLEPTTGLLTQGPMR
jgi:type II secretory pathway pseudopilin PulG